MKGQSALINAGLTGVSTPAEFCDGKYTTRVMHHIHSIRDHNYRTEMNHAWLAHTVIWAEFPLNSCCIHSYLEIVYSRWTPVNVKPSVDTNEIIIIECIKYKIDSWTFISTVKIEFESVVVWGIFPNIQGNWDWSIGLYNYRERIFQMAISIRNFKKEWTIIGNNY